MEFNFNVFTIINMESSDISFFARKNITNIRNKIIHLKHIRY